MLCICGTVIHRPMQADNGWKSCIAHDMSGGHLSMCWWWWWRVLFRGEPTYLVKEGDELEEPVEHEIDRGFPEDIIEEFLAVGDLVRVGHVEGSRLGPVDIVFLKPDGLGRQGARNQGRQHQQMVPIKHVAGCAALV